ncbi:MAG: Nif3-like dinuclear metal center hexameric protein [Clostridia bacterium]|nr:Nif3-like dinuclear metal center hexameric protein [Clostridia bacterium]
MTVNKLYEILNEKIPTSLSCEWDNDGLMCCPDGDREVKKVLIALDVTGAVIDYAAEGGYDLIISHHPFIFKGLKAINGDSHIANGAIKLIKNNISVMSFHTRLDAVLGGVNDTLAALLGLSDVEVFGDNGEEIGRVGTLASEMTLADFCEKVKEVTGAPFVLAASAGIVAHRVAILGGEGGDDISAAKAAGADTYLSGRLGYHNMVDAPEKGMNLVEAGHFYTEFLVCFTVEKMLAEIDSGIKTEIYYSNNLLFF